MISAALVEWRRSCGGALLSAVILALFVTAGSAQEAVRMSLAGEDAARQRREAASTVGYYNLQVGDTSWRFGSSLYTDFNDNINLSQTDPEADVIFRPQLDGQMVWPLTEHNSLNLRFGVGYSFYVLHPDLNRYYLLPGTALSFDAVVGDWLFNFHDRAYVTQNALENPTVTGTGDYAQLQNVVGVSGTWDLNKFIVQLGFDHENFVTLTGNPSQPSGQAEVFSGSLGYQLQPQTIAGLELGTAVVHYDTLAPGVPFQDGLQWNAGGFVDSPLTEYIHMRLHGGYTVFGPLGEALPGSSSLTGMYGDIELQHRLNQYVNYTLAAGRNLSFAFGGGTLDLYFARLAAGLNIIKDYSLAASFDFQHGSQAFGSGEIFDRYALAFNVGRTLSRKLSGSVGYSVYFRTSNQPDQGYLNNILSLNLTYNF